MSDVSPPAVACCPAGDRPLACRILHDCLPEADRPSLLDALNRSSVADFAGLLVARTSRSICGAVLVQPAPGNSAVLWAGPCPHIDELLAAAACFVDSRNVGITQAVLASDGSPLHQLLPAAGFPRLAELIYLFATAVSGELPAAVATRLSLEGGAGAKPQLLGELLKLTYHGSLDCPALDNSRPMSDVLDGYRAQGTHLPEHWYVARIDGQDAGALLLAAHPAVNSWELVYVGVTPQFRGQGIGRALMQHALNVAAENGGERVVVAVDAANAPALSAYAACGYREWDRRRVYARLATHRENRDTALV